MANTPNMLLALPEPTVTQGPEWAAQLNAALQLIDSHDHTSSKGQKVPISGVDINQNLDMQNLQIVDTKALQLNSLSAALSGASNSNKVQVINGNIWFTNGGGVPVQITDGNSIISNVIIPASPLMPSGTVLDFAGGTAPVGFLLCDGSPVSRTTYSNLFAAIGTIWGAGNGTTTFNVPDFSGKTSIGTGTYTDPVTGSVTRSIGQGQPATPGGVSTLGAESHVLTTTQMPSHTHTQAAHSHDYLQVGIAGIRGSGGGSPENPTVGQTGVAQPAISYTGGGLSHNNMQPSLVLTKMIKT